ncbi:LexA repressor [Labeo rohita]|uniref:LexA repressor n=1 Tax=Labeo rohita TaxID=84645 RepID=A0ABQ8LXL7_LABRO|nr:LexA repressor [Labeo rohita]
MSFKTALGLLLLAMLAMVAESFSEKQKGPYSYDLSNKSDLNKLYNSKVYLAELFTRPLQESPFQFYVFSHSGVRVTLQDGSKWLIHKGKNVGISSQTVFKRAANFDGSKTVSDFVRAGGENYNILFDNCHKASNQMMRG